MWENEKEKESEADTCSIFFCCEGTFFYEAASRFSTCREKIGHRVLLIIWQRNNQYFILKWEETSALTTSKHTAYQQVALCWPASFIWQVRGGGKGSFCDLETWLLHLLLGASTWILDKKRERWNYQCMQKSPTVPCGAIPYTCPTPSGRSKFPWAESLMRQK